LSLGYSVFELTCLPSAHKNIDFTGFFNVFLCQRGIMVLFYIVMLAALLLIVGFWNGVTDFKTAYLQSLLFLEVMNWYDGIVIDKVWVGHSQFWVLPGTEDIPFVQTWSQVLKKRCILTLVWAVGAVITAGLVVLAFSVRRCL
jgi:hypothetical protein